jgi:RNA polymerase sigma-70 factor (ECF subfamily)
MVTSANIPAWLAAVRSGDAIALDALVRRYRPWLQVLAQAQLGRRLPGKCDASDLVQQALLDACRGLPEFRGTTEAELCAWLRQVLARALGHELRRYGRTRQRDVGREVSLEQELTESSARLSALITAPDSTPSRRAARHEQELHLAALLARLPEDYRTVIVLRDLEGLPHEEIARRMGRGAGAVRMLWVRALARLRREMEIARDSS